MLQKDGGTQKGGGVPSLEETMNSNQFFVDKQLYFVLNTELHCKKIHTLQLKQGVALSSIQHPLCGSPPTFVCLSYHVFSKIPTSALVGLAHTMVRAICLKNFEVSQEYGKKRLRESILC